MSISNSRNNLHLYRAFSIIELLVIVVIIVIVIAFYLVNGMNNAKAESKLMLCSTHMIQLHQGWILWSQDHKSIYPTPLTISESTANKCAQKGNSSANIHSVMISNKLYTPDLTVCPSETSPYVKICEDYDYGGSSSGLSSADKWDWDFSCDITGYANSARTGKYNSNVSYANMALTANRMKNEWTDSLNADFVVISDRGPQDGISNSKSISYKSHGKKSTWMGNIVYNDGHVVEFKEQVGTQSPFGLATGKLGAFDDNIFAQDDTRDNLDIWLAVFGDTTKEYATPLWD